MRNLALHTAGFLLGSANAIRHKRAGYVTPRGYSPEEVDRSVDHAIRIVNWIERCGKIDWPGQRVLEIGPGTDMATGAVMLARGAASYEAVDLFDNRNLAHQDTYRRLAEKIGRDVNPDALHFTQTSFPDLPALSAKTYDLIVSSACLEHVADIPGLFRRLRVLSPQGKMVHGVDARAHMRWFAEHDQLNMLRYSDRTYSRFLEFPGAPNRLRASEYERAALEAGWSETTIEAQEWPPSDYVRGFRPARRYRHQDLGPSVFVITAV